MLRLDRLLSRIKFLGIVFLFLFSCVPSAMGQQNPYAPEIDYYCDDEVHLDVEYEWNSYSIQCSIINNNPHDVTVQITDDWDHDIAGPYEISEWGYCTDNEMGDEIFVQATSTVTFCYVLSADKYAPAGESSMTSSAEVIRYSYVIPCDACEPSEEISTVHIYPWMTLLMEHEATPETAYAYDTNRVTCQKSDQSELVVTVQSDGNYGDSAEIEVSFIPVIRIRDLIRDEVVEYQESKFGPIDLEFNSELSMEAGETVERTFTASWDFTESPEHYEIRLRTYIEFRTNDWRAYQTYYDECPTWEGVVPIPDQVSNDTGSDITVNLTSPFSVTSTVMFVLLAVPIFRRNQCE